MASYSAPEAQGSRERDGQELHFLARLLDLNKKYAEEEQLTGAAAEAAEKKKAKRGGKKKDGGAGLFGA